MSNEAMIQLRQLKMAFGSKVILDNLDLDVRQGERWRLSVLPVPVRVPSSSC